MAIDSEQTMPFTRGIVPPRGLLTKTHDETTGLHEGSLCHRPVGGLTRAAPAARIAWRPDTRVRVRNGAPAITRRVAR